MAEWWEVPDVSFDLFGGGGGDIPWFDTGFSDFNFNIPDFSFDFQIPDFNFDFQFPDFNIPDVNFGPMPDFTFDPGAFDLGFDPSFDIGQFAQDFADPFALPQGDLSLPTLSLGLGTPFDLSSAGASSIADLDFSPSVMADLTPASLGEVAPMFPSSSDLPSLSPLSQPTFSLDESEPTLGLSSRLNLDNLPSFSNNEPGAPGKSSNDTLRDAQASYYKWAPMLGLGQLGLSLGGGLFSALNQPEPRKPTALENARQQAEIDAIRAKIDLERQALELQREMAGGPETPEDPRMAIAELQARNAMEQAELQAAVSREQMGLEAEVARERMRQEASTAESLRPRSLLGTDPRFSTLYDEVSGAQKTITPDSPEVQQMTQQIYTARIMGLEQEFQRQRDAILERANRLGTNPAAELAQINEAQQQAQQEIMVEAQQVALAFAQDRMDPSVELLNTILATKV
jgi:hypothetical protein